MKLLESKKRKRVSKSLFWAFAVSMMLWSCETDNGEEDPLSIRDNYLGTWQVTENTGINNPQFYTVLIVNGDADDEVLIQGLYNESGTRVVALVNGTQLNIPSQVSADLTFVGNGTANADYSQIALSFSADDGSGPDNVEATLVK